jgi:hypothetical protein
MILIVENDNRDYTLTFLYITDYKLVVNLINNKVITTIVILSLSLFAIYHTSGAVTVRGLIFNRSGTDKLLM